MSRDSSETRDKENVDTSRKVKEKPSSADEWFEKIADGEVRCGALPRSLSTLSSLSVKTVHLWPTVLSRCDPKKVDLVTLHGNEGELIRAFRLAARKAYSTGLQHEEPVLTRWQEDRINELTGFFRDVARSYVFFAIDETLGVETNCRVFYQTLETTLSQANNKSIQLASDLLYKISGPRIAQAFKTSLIINPTEFPASMSAIIKLAAKTTPRDGRGNGYDTRHDFFSDDADRYDHGRGGGRGRGTYRGRGGGAGRGRGGESTQHVPGVCSTCKGAFTGHISSHRAACPGAPK